MPQSQYQQTISVVILIFLSPQIANADFPDVERSHATRQQEMIALSVTLGILVLAILIGCACYEYRSRRAAAGNISSEIIYANVDRYTLYQSARNSGDDQHASTTIALPHHNTTP